MAVVLLFGGLWPGLGIHKAKAAGPTIIYVKMATDGGNDGNDGISWATAVATLQLALDKAIAGEQIWIAAGTYYPTKGIERERHFEMKNGVAIYGGFEGNEDSDFSLDDRDYTTNKTILSGDFDGIDGNKAYHVFHNYSNGIDQTALLDGVTITGGNANGGGMDSNGGGMLNIDSSSPTLANVTISGNTADYGGGGLYNYSKSSPTLTDVMISGNTAEYGGGMYNNTSSPTLANVTISGNTAEYGGGMYNNNRSPSMTDVTLSGNTAFAGGGMYNYTSSPTLTDVTISGNTAYYGGGMYNNTSSPPMTDVTISGNTADYGGGMYNYTCSSAMTNVTLSGNVANKNGGGVYNLDSSPSLTNVTISGNSSGSGGGMFNLRTSSQTLTNVTITGNTATDNGGGMVNFSSNPTLTNVILIGNTATKGGGMFNNGGSPTLTNVTLSGNQATDAGGGIYNFVGSNPNIRNSIIWGNTSGSGYGIINESDVPNSPSKPNLNHSLIEGSGGSGNWNTAFGIDGRGNIDRNPMFQGDYSLRSYSPAINKGDNSVFAAGQNGQNPDLSGIHTDFGGNPRIVGALIDMGAYEYQGLATAIDKLKASPAPVNMRLEANKTQQLSVKATLSDTTTDDVTSPTLGTTYTSDDPTVAMVTADGLIEAKKVGSTTITITNSGITTTVQVNVFSFDKLKALPAPVNMRLEANKTQQLSVKATLSDTTTDDLTSPTLGTTYTSNDPTIATVTADGLIEAKKVGTTTITISNSGITTTVEVNVTSTSSSSGAWIPSGDAHLRELIVRADGKTIPLTPVFAADTTEYRVETAALQVDLTGTAVHSSANVTLQGKTVKDGIRVDLHEGDNVFTFLVTAENGATKTYTLTVKRIKEGQEPPHQPISFTDIDGHWAEVMILQAATKGIASGYPDDTFRPNHSVTRAEFVVMLANAKQSIHSVNTSPRNHKDASLTFIDADKIGVWAKEAVAYAVEAGIVNGYKDGSFRPNARITRAEMATMIAHALGLTLETNKATAFADDANIPAWAKSAIEATRKLGIVSGRSGNRFIPMGEATRAEAAVLLLRMLDHKDD
ncbi:S-layer homology domain-containing protein [Cohnella abietis]|nr:S-layer homology domain-containing protein [Cohnella abietis]